MTTMTPQLQNALTAFASAMADADDGLGHLTCPEFGTMLELLVAAGLTDAAAKALQGHAMGDYQTSDHHHALYKAMEDGNDTDPRVQELVAQFIDDARRLAPPPG